eukprot:TRINITY_DN3272_c1_g1_i1.p1 TRINITY_DN3272_c1_g1~~TRINITY_DN3272_c1_g1_i1.p1  ORF type:complete len:374 (+),score=44.98 TRINITY_DN3272_c1_g1_i1:59-1123(+)
MYVILLDSPHHYRILSIVTPAFLYLLREIHILRQSLVKEKKKREDERTGRTRAEKVSVRSLFSHSSQKLRETLNQNNPVSGQPKSFQMDAIGILCSAFRDRRGTPRQGCLVPHSTAFIEFHPHVSAALSLSGLQEFSHVWVLGYFHENTNVGKSGGVSAKIKPPRLGGEKIGLYSTRTPHRHNPISLSLAKIDRIETVNFKGRLTTRLWLAGIDLIHNTPILDIKPYIQLYDMAEESKVASWVEEQDEVIGFKFERVVIPELVQENFKENVSGHLQFYPPNQPDVFLKAVKEVLTTDIRSQFQRSLGKNSTAPSFSFRLDVVKIDFNVEGCTVVVTRLTLDDLHEGAKERRILD